MGYNDYFTTGFKQAGRIGVVLTVSRKREQNIAGSSSLA